MGGAPRHPSRLHRRHNVMNSNAVSPAATPWLRHRYAIELLVFGLVVVVVFGQLRFPTTSGSNSNVEQWVNLTNQMFRGDQDFLFSYGPLFWLTGGTTSMYSALAYWTSIALVCAINGIFWAALVAVAARRRALLLFGVTYVLFFGSPIVNVALFMWPLSLVAWLHYAEPTPRTLSRLMLFVLGVLVSVALYMRFFYGTVATLTFGAYFFGRALRRRRIDELAMLTVGGVLGYVFIGLVIFHHPASLAQYLIINSQLSFGNSVDMTLQVTNSTKTFVAAGCVALALNLFGVLRRPALLLPIDALFLVLFKLGFSRTDHYIAYFVVPMAVVCCLMLFDGGRLGRLLFVVSVAALYVMCVSPSYPGGPVHRPLRPAVNFDTPYDARMASVYPQFKLSDPVLARIGKQSIDVYPYHNEYAFANGLNYVHRPVFQNYMTLTPKLDAMNEEFFESSGRPRFVLWTAGIACGNAECNPFDGFDGKLALNEDPLTSSTILLNYHPVEMFKTTRGIPATLLEANDKHVRYAEEPLSNIRDVRFGEWLEIPKNVEGVVKLKPQLRFTLRGRLKNMLFRGGLVLIHYRLSTGEERVYRANILNAESGIWVSPLPNGFSWQGVTVTAVKLETPNSGYLTPTFDAQWIEVPIKQFKLQPFDRPVALPSGVEYAEPLNCDGSIDASNEQNPIPASIRASGILRLQGWLAASASDGRLTDRTFVTVTDSFGQIRFAPTHLQHRPDVATAYGHASLTESGFESKLDLSDLRGKYMLGLAQQQGGALHLCRQFQVQLEVAP